MAAERLTTQAAAEYLSQQFPAKTAEQWALWLRNNRNQARRAIYRVKAEQIGRSAFYAPDELAAFVTFEKSRELGTIKLTGRAAEVMHAYGIGTRGGSGTGRKFNVTSINPQIDDATGKPYVQLITDDPLMVYRLEPGQAKAISEELAEVVACCERASGNEQPRNDAGIKVMRKKSI